MFTLDVQRSKINRSDRHKDDSVHKGCQAVRPKKESFEKQPSM